jgi:hypothetical protein
MSPRTVIVGVRSRRRRIGSSMRISTVAICDSGIRWPAFPTKVKSVIRLGSSRACPAERAMTCTERMSSRTSVIGTPLNRN